MLTKIGKAFNCAKKRLLVGVKVSSGKWCSPHPGAINDYNFRRPNSGVGGFAPNAVHHMGRSALCERRAQGRQNAREMRINHWKQESRTTVITGLT